MAEVSGIEWCDSTFNPWIGCTKISPACDHCYAEALMDTRHHRVKWGGSRLRTGTWHEPKRWQRQAKSFLAEHGRRRRVFCASLADVFDNQVPIEWRDDLWTLIRETPDLDWLLLTKRPQNIGKMLPAFWDAVKGHVWLGTTIEDQKRANQNIPHLLQHDAAVRFVSIEPMLGPVDLADLSKPAGIGTDFYSALECDVSPEDDEEWGGRSIDWVIAGGESGPLARPSHPDWFRSLRDQCAAAGVPFLFKQWGEWAPGECATRAPTRTERTATFFDENWTNPGWVFETVTVRQSEEMHIDDEPDLWRFGKKHSGRHLDGLLHNGFPEVSA